MRTKVIGQEFITLGSVDSTNKHAAELLAQGKLSHGAVILADEQTAGRGQRGRIWRSGSGLDLTASVLLHFDHLKASEQFVLAKIVSLAVHDVVSAAMKMAVDRGSELTRIKWPNDVLIDRRKVSGILIKNDVVGGLVMNSIVGIGINVNSGDLDAEFNATSLRMETGMEHDRLALLEHLCQRLEHHLGSWQNDTDSLGRAYTSLLWGRGRYTAFELDGQPFSARPMDVDEDGRLLVEDEEGKVRVFGYDRLRFAPR
jgi:BirA family biotin operon repressor/biotin-[acetyl-CoA-carboxylase] ligase